MQAIIVSEYGGPEVLTEVELPDPHPGPGQVSIDVIYAAVGLIDTFVRLGALSDGSAPVNVIPGLEVSGTIRELGEGVTGFQVGEPVVTLTMIAMSGYASIAVAEAALTVSLDGHDIDPAQAVAVVPNVTTAYLALTYAGRMHAGESVAIHGATGALAFGFPAAARALGASTVIGTVRNTAQIEEVSGLGYDQVVASEGFVEALNGDTFDIIVDPVGGELRRTSLDALGSMGRLLAVGHADSGPDVPLPSDTLWQRNLAVIGFSAGRFLPENRETGRPAAELFLNSVAAGDLSMPLQVLPLARAAEAHRRLEGPRLPGRIVLEVSAH